MKITDIKTIKLQYPYKKWIADGCGSCGARGAFLILVETDTDLTGIGESATFVYGSLDPSYRYAELIRVLEKKNLRIHLEIADGQDHYFSKNGFDLAELAERYLFTTF